MQLSSLPLAQNGIKDFRYGQLNVELAANQLSFLGVESAREDVGITVLYWTDLDSIENWRNKLEHQEVR